jgi:hypothetical protein
MKDQKPGAGLDAMLLALPIRPENLSALTAIRREVEALAKDRDSWKSQFELYAGSWLRNLGGAIFNKRHRIDALAMTTDHQREGCARATRAGLIGQAFYGSDPKDKERHARVTLYAKDTAA